MKVLNLYAGLGGNRKHWADADVTAVEKTVDIAEVCRDQYPGDQIVIGDAHDYLLNNYQDFDFIWSSPPCQSHSRMIRSGKNRKPRYPDMKLYEEILFLRHNFKGPWIVENVRPYYQPLIEFKSIGRHLFWSNFDFPYMEEKRVPNFISGTNLESSRKLMDWLGIHYDKSIYYEGNHCPAQVLRNCVHPDVGKHIFDEVVKQWG